MAGDWIKMRSNLWDDPRVARLCDLTDQPEAAVVGALYWLWATADQHSEDGHLPGLSVRSIDRKSGVNGIGQALESVGWIRVENDGITLVRFAEHNGSSAKRRAQEARRKAVSRDLSASDADTKRTKSGIDAELEKEKEKEKVKSNGQTKTPDRFPEFWSAYPKKVKKQDARKKWKSRKLDSRADEIIADVERRKAKDGRWLDGYVPDPTTYINGERWEDEIESPRNSSTEDNKPLGRVLQ